ncbi:MAG TPA: SLC13 family permease [Nitrospirota bacterium]|nr:SLC13 family permease [Nitrospirota bacterium]
MIIALVIFLITYLLIGLRQIPRVHINRPAGALVGAVLMVVFGVLTLEQAFAAVDMHTLLLLLGMMIITVYLRLAGFFELMAARILSLSKTPFHLLVLVTVSSGLLSALFVNDTICLLYTPIVLAVTVQLGVNPVPYLLALAAGSNIGSVMTVTGNPQNMLIGIYSGIPYLSFLGALFPVALIGFAVCIGVVRFVYRSEMTQVCFMQRPKMPEYRVNVPLLTRSLLVCAGVLVAFSLGYPYSLSAAAGAVVLLVIGGVSTERVLEGVDWTLLLFFAGLFIVMHGVEVSGLAGRMIEKAGVLIPSSFAGRITGLSVVSAVLSNAVSNVPAVMLLKPFAESLGGDRTVWLALAMSSTLAGNFTLIGSVANLIVVQQARREVEIGFLEYFRVGALITIITIAAGVLVLVAEVRMAHGAEGMARAAEEQPKIVTIIPAGAAKSGRTFRVVLVCDTVQKRVQGLQGFRRLRREEAALFVLDKPEPATFWMGKVEYAIDIVFVDAEGKVVRIFSDRRPGSRELFSSGVPVKWVIETRAGSGVREGERMVIR